MAKVVEFWFDVGSPAAYLAHTQIRDIAARCGGSCAYKPMLLGGVFQATGNQSPGAIPAKGKWTAKDFPRWAKRYGVPYRKNPFFPINTLQLMRGATAALQDGCVVEYADALFKAIWVDGRNAGLEAEWREILTAAGLDAERLIARSQDPAVKNELKTRTEEAVARGVFGAPSFFVGDSLNFGQDRLDFVAEDLRAA